MNVSDIAYAIDCEGKFYSVFPIWIGESLAKLTPIVDPESFESTGESFRLLLGDLFDEYILLDHNQMIIHEPMEDEDE